MTQQVRTPASTKTRTVAVCTAVAAVAALASGCGGKTQTESSSYEVTEKVTTLRVQGSGSTIDVTAKDQGPVRVTETLRFDGTKPEATHSVRGGDLSLRAGDCGSHMGSSTCAVDYRIELPRTMAVHLNSDGGDVSVRGLAGVTDVQADGGSVRAEEMTAKRFSASSGGGRVTAQFTSAPDSVRISSDGGAATVRVPDAGYATQLRADGGNERSSVRTDPGSTRRITIQADGGNITLSPN
ncbi:hypothetical protein [Streptomyces sp. NPDC052496]|uniref:hypothetical protein n=1 Tax=Streptomyces sp. NPDC052496 TaxID=3154951 RepID=UPI00341FF3D9